MYKIILGIFILCYGLYNAYTGDYTNSYSLIESIGSSLFLIVVGWTLFFSGVNKRIAVLMPSSKDKGWLIFNIPNFISDFFKKTNQIKFSGKTYTDEKGNSIHITTAGKMRYSYIWYVEIFLNFKKFLIKNLIAVILLILFLTSFYWFQYRPSEIRKECYRLMSQEYSNFDVSFKYYEPEYKSCLLKNGITN
jgi:hypothetical protein